MEVQDCGGATLPKYKPLWLEVASQFGVGSACMKASPEEQAVLASTSQRGGVAQAYRGTFCALAGTSYYSPARGLTPMEVGGHSDLLGSCSHGASASLMDDNPLNSLEGLQNMQSGPSLVADLGSGKQPIHWRLLQIHQAINTVPSTQKACFSLQPSELSTHRKEDVRFS